jgi:hypothetical protein
VHLNKLQRNKQSAPVKVKGKKRPPMTIHSTILGSDMMGTTGCTVASVELFVCHISAQEKTVQMSAVRREMNEAQYTAGHCRRNEVTLVTCGKGWSEYGQGYLNTEIWSCRVK